MTLIVFASLWNLTGQVSTINISFSILFSKLPQNSSVISDYSIDFPVKKKNCKHLDNSSQNNMVASVIAISHNWYQLSSNLGRKGFISTANSLPQSINHHGKSVHGFKTAICRQELTQVMEHHCSLTCFRFCT